jgi:hypothetical protein
MAMNRKCTLAGAHGSHWCDSHREGLERYVESLQNLTDCDHVVATNELPGWFETMLNGAGVHILKREKKVIPDRESNRFALDCYMARLDFMRKCEYETVIHTDSCDVTFQVDIPVMKGLHLVSEGMTHADSQFNREDQEKFRPHDWRDLLPRDVVNGGTHIGSKWNLIAFYETLLTYTANCSRTYTDQAVANFLAWKCGFGKNVHHPAISDLCLTGEGVRYGVQAIKDAMGDYVDPFGRPYMIVHQEWRMSLCKLSAT